MEAVLDTLAVSRVAAMPAAALPVSAPQGAALLATPTPADLLRIALQSTDLNLDRLERLMDMQLKWEANEAKKAFAAAMAAFKEENVQIYKNKRVYFKAKNSGATTDYNHAELSDCTDAIGPVAARHGLTYDWDIRQEAGIVIVDCNVTHVLGHSKTVTMKGPHDDSGNKNKIQQAGSSVTYLERYTLLASFGLSTKHMDDDGAGGSSDEDHSGSEQDATLNLVDTLIAEGLKTKTDAAALSYWQTNNAKLKDDPAGHKRLKTAIMNHRTGLRTKQAATQH